MVAASPRPGSPSCSSRGASSRSTRARCSRESQAVSRATSMARHSVVSPARNAASVWGSSLVRIAPSRLAAGLIRRAPLGQRDLFGDRPARPAPIRATTGPGEHALARCEAANAAVSRACAAASAALSSSNCRIRSIRSASSPAGLAPASAESQHDRSAALGPLTWVSLIRSTLDLGSDNGAPVEPAIRTSDDNDSNTIEIRWDARDPCVARGNPTPGKGNHRSSGHRPGAKLPRRPKDAGTQRGLERHWAHVEGRGTQTGTKKIESGAESVGGAVSVPHLALIDLVS